MGDHDKPFGTFSPEPLPATVQRADRIGRVIAGKYRIDTLIGAGGMGRVYAAEHLALGERVAVKFLLGVWATVAETRARFQREAVALARLRHPSIVSILDFGEDEGEPFMVMELVRGSTMFKVALSRDEPMDLPRIGRVFDQILVVLEAAHGLGIVHRDLKLENVMLVPQGSGGDLVKVLDFGLAHVEIEGGARLTETGAVRGTPHYMSPEQCRGQNVGAPTDIYAVGVMLYEAISTSLPFEASDAAQLMAQHLYVEPPPLGTSGIRREVSAGLEALVMRALAKRAADRPTATEMRAALAAALVGADAPSRAAADALDRARVGALSREERALGGGERKTAVDGRDASLASARVVLWGLDAERASALATALGVAGMRASSCDDDAVPRDLEGASALLLADGDAALERMARARAASARPLPVLIVDVKSAERTAQLVRADVSDVAHVSLGPEEIVRKLKRLAKRKT